MMAPAAHRDVLDLVERWAEAERSADAGGLDGLFVDDVRLVGPAGFMLD